jgi:outer membrane protein, heavy metal efflux system
VRCQRTGIVVFVSVNLVSLAVAERPIDPQPSDLLRIPANWIHGSVTEPLIVDLAHGIGPDEAATIALFSNPALRSIRDRRGLASAQLIQAGILPNPVVSYERDYVTGGNTLGTRTGYTFNAGWEFSALIPFLPKQTAARKNFGSVDLDVAWQEWQIAVNARTAVYRVLGLDAQTARAREATSGLQQSIDTMRKAVDAHEKTVLDLAAVESASQDSRRFPGRRKST